MLGIYSVPGIVGETDNLFEEAIKACIQYDRASASLLQRRLSIGYARAARLIDQLQDAGVLAPSDGSSKPREVLMKSFEEFQEKYKIIPINNKVEENKEILKKYTPIVADFLPEEVKSLTSPLDLPYLNTDFKRIGNLIVTGNVISKKFEFVKTYLLFILSKFNLSEVNLIIDDGTGSLNKFMKIPHILAKVENYDHSLSALRWLCREMDRRIQMMNKDEKVTFPTIVYIGNILNLFTMEHQDAIKRISSIGAYAGVHMILLADRLADFEKMVRDNITARLEFNKFGDPEAVFTFKNKTSIKLEILDDNKIKEYLDNIKS